jgi:hypothetical protein
MRPASGANYKHVHRVVQLERLDGAATHTLPQGYKLTHFGGCDFGDTVLHAEAAQQQVGVVSNYVATQFDNSYPGRLHGKLGNRTIHFSSSPAVALVTLTRY